MHCCVILTWSYVMSDVLFVSVPVRTVDSGAETRRAVAIICPRFKDMPLFLRSSFSKPYTHCTLATARPLLVRCRVSVIPAFVQGWGVHEEHSTVQGHECKSWQTRHNINIAIEKASWPNNEAQTRCCYTPTSRPKSTHHTVVHTNR